MHEFNPLLALFPGQGSQHVGMGKDLYLNFALARNIFEEASDAVHVDLKRLCFDGPESDLTLTENTQPCLLATSVAAFRVAVAETGLKPGAVAGHSLGEYSALVAAGALNLATAAAWVRARGMAMQEAVPAGQGTMAALIGITDEAVVKLCEKATELAKADRTAGVTAELTVDAIVEPANFNAPGQVVIAGSTDAVAKAIELTKSDPEFSGKAIPLSVSAPFHCRLMAPARERMAEIFAAASRGPSPLHCPYFPNRTARATLESGVIFDLLVDQVDHAVLWSASMSAALNGGYTMAIEFGPGKVLSTLLKRIAQPLGKSFSALSVGDSAGVKGIESFLKGVATQ